MYFKAMLPYTVTVARSNELLRAQESTLNQMAERKIEACVSEPF